MRKLAALPSSEARARSAWQYLGTTSTAIALFATLAKHDIASPARVPISTMSRPANLRASAVCTASGERMGEISTGKINAAQSTPLTDCRSWRCDSLSSEARPRSEANALPSMTIFAKVGPTEMSSSANALEWDRRIARWARFAQFAISDCADRQTDNQRNARPNVYPLVDKPGGRADRQQHKSRFEDSSTVIIKYTRSAREIYSKPSV